MYVAVHSLSSYNPATKIPLMSAEDSPSSIRCDIAGVVRSGGFQKGECMAQKTKKTEPANAADARGNRLLAALPDDAFERLRIHLEPIAFSLGEVVYESGGHMEYVYFPTTSHISLLYTMIDGSTAEMGLVGQEGVVGIALFMGGETTPNRAMVQGGGIAFRMKAKAMLNE